MVDQKIIGQEPKLLKILKIIKRIIGITLSTIFILIILINLFMIVKMAINPDEIPDFFGYKFLVITTGSMKDTIGIGDFIIIQDVKELELKEQDIISFHDNKDIVTHRIIEIRKENGESYYVTKGDNNNVKDDGEVLSSEIIGKYVFTIPFIGHVVLFTQTTSGMLVLILIPIIILFFVYWKRQRQDIKELERDTKRIEYSKTKKK